MTWLIPGLHAGHLRQQTPSLTYTYPSNQIDSVLICCFLDSIHINIQVPAKTS